MTEGEGEGVKITKTKFGPYGLWINADRITQKEVLKILCIFDPSLPFVITFNK